MNGLFNKKGELKTVFKISNITVEDGSEIKLCVPNDIVPFLYFRFQTKKFKFRDITESLIDEIETEIFPGIYIKGTECKNKLKKFINFVLQRKQYLIKNENKKDFFKICSELEKQEMNYYTGDIISTMIERINPMIVKQPGNLGGGRCSGCPIIDYFHCLGMIGERDIINDYYFFSDIEVIDATKKEEFFLEKCRKSKCFNTYEKIISEGYSENLSNYDQIKIEYQNDEYTVGEGKHRICAMRRFGYSKEIPVRLTRISDSLRNSNIMCKQYFSDNKHVLESCYNGFEKIGISSEDVRVLLKKPNATILDYLNKSRFSYEDILKFKDD